MILCYQTHTPCSHGLHTLLLFSAEHIQLAQVECGSKLYRHVLCLCCKLLEKKVLSLLVVNT